MNTPRPILKTRPSPLSECFPSPAGALPFRFPISPHVHFPPTPTLTDTQVTHSPFVYDRAPIVVSPNICKLPKRGGRDYSAYTPPMGTSSRGGYFDFRSPSVCDDDEHDTDEHPPPLVHDHSSSSESDESDACIASPVQPYTEGVDMPPMHDQDTTCAPATAAETQAEADGAKGQAAGS
ncbi:hypothetical protein DXG01_009346 [Tephrocybe rancida]|nr:hypothetical protein DXG01_009346 [Tephrocybe rancida]